MNDPLGTLGPEIISTAENIAHSIHCYRSATAKAAMQRRVERGECPGVAPLGYRNVIVDGRRTVEPDPTTAPLIVEAFRMAARKDGSLRKILAELSVRGLRSKRGNPLGVSSLQAILTNPFYAGLISLNGELVTGVHRALISRSLFRKIKACLSGRRCR